MACSAAISGVLGVPIGAPQHHHGAMTDVDGGGEPRPSYLIVEDSVAYGRSLKQVLGRWGDATIVRSARDAQVAVRAKAWSAVVLDVHLPDGSGLDVLARIRGLRPATPVLVLTGDNEPEAINLACELGASFAVKPVNSSLLRAFVESAASLPKRLASAADTWQRRYGLTNGERDVLLRAALGTSRTAIAAARRSSILTVKKQCEHISKKTGGGSFYAAAARLVREVAGR